MERGDWKHEAGYLEIPRNAGCGQCKTNNAVPDCTGGQHETCLVALRLVLHIFHITVHVHKAPARNASGATRNSTQQCLRLPHLQQLQIPLPLTLLLLPEVLVLVLTACCCHLIMVARPLLSVNTQPTGLLCSTTSICGIALWHGANDGHNDYTLDVSVLSGVMLYTLAI